MKKLLAMAVMSLAATQAMAGVKLVVRSDYVYTGNYDNNAGAEVESTSVFVPDVARMYFSGNVGDAVIDSAFNLRSFSSELAFDPTKDTAGQKVMTVDTFVEHLFITKNHGDWSFSGGKLWMNVGGFERRAFYDGDTYLTSLANGGIGGAATINPFLTGSVLTPENSSGISAAYKIAENHKVEVQLYNQVNRDSDLLTATNKRHSYGVAYWGSFAEKMFQTYLSYNMGAGDDRVTGGHELSYIAAGFRIAPMENLNIDLEYLANSDKTALTDEKDETTSTILEARYKMGMWTPILKYEMSTDKLQGEDNFKRDAWALALELTPKAEDAFRYHVAYTSIKDRDFGAAFGANTEDMTKNMITVGFKYVGDIAK
ncbi:hypothetical protein QJS83_09005 [Bdellovibrio sp. 22V]|uniref:hypothetical protein n=1 Tax=Bdellovibrio sp. 22V TaxID=3044166 RepID=UPI002542FEF5|nr:hypothetical protein [Bdellovibrio sp. 22V]WII70595.1 hypothetical protein QJS83_09005 [Bdellovibrio sp. 22V]